MSQKNALQETSLLAGARSAYNYIKSLYPDRSGFQFKFAEKNDGTCGKGWFRNPDELCILSVIFVADNKTYRITSLNPEWTEFSTPVLLGDGPWVGVSDQWFVSI